MMYLLTLETQVLVASKDPRRINVNIIIGGKKEVKALLDQGGSINLMP